jgi:hypothetical protein
MAYGNYAPFYRGGYFNPMQTPTMPNMENQNMQTSQPFSQPFTQPMTMQSQTNDMMIWVLSEGEAQSYPVAPNNSVILWDKNSDVVYIKSVNAQNVPSFRVLDYKERTADNAPKSPDKHECKCGDKFVLKKDFQALQSEFDALRSELEELKTKSKAKNAKKAVEEVEENE